MKTMKITVPITVSKHPKYCDDGELTCHHCNLDWSPYTCSIFDQELSSDYDSEEGSLLKCQQCIDACKVVNDVHS